MDDINRLLERNYEPSDQDIVKARLRTLGVQEYHFVIPRGMYPTFDARGPSPDPFPEGWHQDLVLYDVGGSRTSVSRILPLNLAPPDESNMVW